MPRLSFEDLPDAARLAVEGQAGRIKTSHDARGGTGSTVAALLATDASTVFVKGVPVDSAQILFQGREIIVGSYLPRSAPRLLWHVEAGGWSLLGYEALDGTHPDFLDSDHLMLVLEALNEVQHICLPPSIGLPLADVRWGGYADEGRAHLFSGTALLHTDVTPGNILLGERAHLIHWAWPTRGAAFIDPYLLALRLVAAGHSPAEAIAWVRKLGSWREAPAEALEAFAVACTRWWRAMAYEDPQPWKVTVAGKASELRTFLLTTPSARNCA